MEGKGRGWVLIGLDCSGEVSGCDGKAEDEVLMGRAAKGVFDQLKLHLGDDGNDDA